VTSCYVCYHITVVGPVCGTCASSHGLCLAIVSGCSNLVLPLQPLAVCCDHGSQAQMCPVSHRVCYLTPVLLEPMGCSIHSLKSRLLAWPWFEPWSRLASWHGAYCASYAAHHSVSSLPLHTYHMTTLMWFLSMLQVLYLCIRTLPPVVWESCVPGCLLRGSCLVHHHVSLPPCDMLGPQMGSV
jgi:hypothetical protein